VSADRAIKQINVRIELIEELLEVYAPLFERVQHGTPDLIETTAFASVLHSFYTGIENIFSRVAKEIDQVIPTGADLHQALLDQSSRATATRSAVISEELRQILSSYLKFRHFYRHVYSSLLDWTQLEKLVTPLHEVWARTKAELLAFVATLRANDPLQPELPC
jgi:GTP1/Obg family GTP-binding protein